MKFAQVDPEVTFNSKYELIEFGLPELINLKGNKKYVFIFDTDKQTFGVENYYWFKIKNWINIIKSKVKE